VIDFGLWQSQKTGEVDIITPYQELDLATVSTGDAEHVQTILPIVLRR
jgi:hypothetical protein